jgi:elongation factor G
MIVNVNNNEKERVFRLCKVYADDLQDVPSIKVGDIGAVVGLKSTRTGITTICVFFSIFDKGILLLLLKIKHLCS